MLPRLMEGYAEDGTVTQSYCGRAVLKLGPFSVNGSDELSTVVIGFVESRVIEPVDVKGVQPGYYSREQSPPNTRPVSAH